MRVAGQGATPAVLPVMKTRLRISLLVTTATLIGGLALAACGSNDSSTPTAAATGGGETVSTADINGQQVVVDSSGDALYSPAQEANGKILCTGDCAKEWVPLTVAGTPTTSSDVSGSVSTVKRPDGDTQVTLDGAPLYTFAEDGGPGNVTGDGEQDSFGGMDFTWHVVSAGGSSGSQSSTTTSSGSGGSGYSY